MALSNFELEAVPFPPSSGPDWGGRTAPTLPASAGRFNDPASPSLGPPSALRPPPGPPVPPTQRETGPIAWLTLGKLPKALASASASGSPDVVKLVAANARMAGDVAILRKCEQRLEEMQRG